MVGLLNNLGYKAVKKENGDLVIFDVPIFCTCERDGIVFDEKWLIEAFNKAKLSEREGYLPPLHIQHHDLGAKVRASGFFRLSSLGVITLKGKRRTAIFADLIITDLETQRLILERRLPYRSIEIFDVNEPSIDGLALLDHEAPFLELPMLMVSEVKDEQGRVKEDLATFADAKNESDWSFYPCKEDDPVVCFFRKANRVFCLTSEEKLMEDVKDKEKLPFQGSHGKNAPNALTDENEEFCNPKKKKKTKKSFQDDKSSYNIEALIEAIESGEISVRDMDLLLAAIQKQMAKKTTSSETIPEIKDEGEKIVETMQKNELDSKELVSEIAQLKAENEKLRMDIESLKQEKIRENDVMEAMTKLKNRPVGADIEKKLMAFHKKYGRDAFNEYVESLVNTTPEIDPNVEKAMSFGKAESQISETALKYQKYGPDAVEKAIQFSKEWQTLSNLGHTKLSEERYIEINMQKIVKGG